MTEAAAPEYSEFTAINSELQRIQKSAEAGPDISMAWLSPANQNNEFLAVKTGRGPGRIFSLFLAEKSHINARQRPPPDCIFDPDNSQSRASAHEVNGRADVETVTCVR